MALNVHDEKTTRVYGDDRELHITCCCGEAFEHAIHISLWDDEPGEADHVIFSVGVRPKGVWGRLKVSLKYLFYPGHWNDWSDGVLDAPKIDKLIAFLARCSEEIKAAEKTRNGDKAEIGR